MFRKCKLFVSIIVFTMVGVSSALSQCPDITGNWTCDNGHRFKIRHEMVNDYDVFKIYVGDVHFVYTASDDGSVPSYAVMSRKKIAIKNLGASCLVDSNDQSLFRVGRYANSANEGDQYRLIVDYSISDDQLQQKLSLVRDITSNISDIEVIGGRSTFCKRSN